MDNADMSMKAIVVVEPVIQTGVPKPGETKIDSEIVFAFEPMDVDVVVNPTVASVDEEEQTIPNASVYLPDSVFSHGQFYVALSRGISRSTTKANATSGLMHLIAYIMDPTAEAYGLFCMRFTFSGVEAPCVLFKLSFSCMGM
nr:hypothetical protein [Tanacetum cinerariifolium]